MSLNRPPPYKGHLRIQIPARNEAATVAAVVSESLAAAGSLLGAECRVSALVVDDGSQDATAAIVRALALSDPRVLLLVNQQPHGLGRSFRLGLQRARLDDVDHLVHIDADGQFDPSQLPLLLRPLLREEADLVVGSRFHPNSPRPVMPFGRRLGNAAVAELVSYLSGIHLHDASCGFRAFSRRAIALLAERCRSNFTYTHESLLLCAGEGFGVLEVPIAALGERPSGRSRLVRSNLDYGLRASPVLVRTYWERRMRAG